MNLITTLEHAYSAAAKEIVTVGKFITSHVVPALRQVQGAEVQIEAVTGLVSPQAVNIERIAFAILGHAVKAADTAGAAAEAGGLNIQLDASLVADLKAVVAAIKDHAAASTLPGVAAAAKS